VAEPSAALHIKTRSGTAEEEKKSWQRHLPINQQACQNNFLVTIKL